MKVLICGSRGWRYAPAIERRIASLPEDATVIHGDAMGPDRLAGLIAKARGLTVEVFPADWKRLGKAAGIHRNLQMLDEQPGLVIAFWDGLSRGTKHTIDEARKRGIPVEVISP